MKNKKNSKKIDKKFDNNQTGFNDNGVKFLFFVVVIILLALEVSIAMLWVNVGNLKKEHNNQSSENTQKFEQQTEQLSEKENVSVEGENNTNSEEQVNGDNVKEENENTVKEENEEIVTQESTEVIQNGADLQIKGRYEREEQDSNRYYKEVVMITEQTGDSINFEITAVNGRNVNDVNNGELKGTAKKIETNIYEFTEDRGDGKTSKITFTFTGDESYKMLDIVEEYSEGLNPYGGAGVFFAGNFDRIGD